MQLRKKKKKSWFLRSIHINIKQTHDLLKNVWQGKTL